MLFTCFFIIHKKEHFLFVFNNKEYNFMTYFENCISFAIILLYIRVAYFYLIWFNCSLDDRSKHYWALNIVGRCTIAHISHHYQARSRIVNWIPLKLHTLSVHGQRCGRKLTLRRERHVSNGSMYQLPRKLLFVFVFHTNSL